MENSFAKVTRLVIFILCLSITRQKELIFLGDTTRGPTKQCNTPTECYLEAINLLYSMKSELNTERENLRKNFEMEKADLQKKFDEKYQSLVGISPVGQINFYSLNKLEVKDEDIPKNWVICDGRALGRNEFSDLFKILETQYGSGDGQTTFNIPDLRGRVIVGAGQGPSLNLYKPGDKGGEEMHSLSENEMPNHSHYSLMYNTQRIYYQNGALQTLGMQSTSYEHNHRTWTTGGSQPHNNMQPYLSIYPIIRIK